MTPDPDPAGEDEPEVAHLETGGGLPGAGRGALALVSTPIGNLGDLRDRVRRVLEAADVIACEDTRRTGRLLQLAGIAKRPLTVVNDHTEEGRATELVSRAGAGELVALVSDAGTPGIADPGVRLVRSAIEAGVEVVPVPGPTALVSALVVSGMATDRFVFEGFLPRKGSERTARLARIAAEDRTIVLYEAPHRVLRTLVDLAEACGEDRSVAVCRELTKLHEDVFRGSLGEAVEALGSSGPRGEHVIVVAGAPAPEPATDDEVLAALADEIDRGASKRDAVAAVVSRLGVAKRRVYDLANR